MPAPSPLKPFIYYDNVDLVLTWNNTDGAADVDLGVFNVANTTDLMGAIDQDLYAGDMNITPAQWNTTLTNYPNGANSYTFPAAAFSGCQVGQRYGVRVEYKGYIDGSNQIVWPQPVTATVSGSNCGVASAKIRNPDPTGTFTLQLVRDTGVTPNTFRYTWNNTQGQLYEGWYLLANQTIEITDPVAGGLLITLQNNVPGGGSDTVTISRPATVSQTTTNTGLTASTLTSAPQSGSCDLTLTVTTGPIYKFTWGTTSSAEYSTWDNVPSTVTINDGATGKGEISCSKGAVPTTTPGTYIDSITVRQPVEFFQEGYATGMDISSIANAPAPTKYWLNLTVGTSGADPTFKWTWGTTDSAQYTTWANVPNEVSIIDPANGTVTMTKASVAPTSTPGTYGDVIQINGR